MAPDRQRIASGKSKKERFKLINAFIAQYGSRALINASTISHRALHLALHHVGSHFQLYEAMQELSAHELYDVSCSKSHPSQKCVRWDT